MRLFEGAGGSNVRYVGRFAVDETQPYIEREAPETGGGPMRRVLVFRLREVPDRGSDELFDDAWEQLRDYLTEARGWESLVEQKRYRLDTFTETTIDYTRLSTGNRTRSPSKSFTTYGTGFARLGGGSCPVDFFTRRSAGSVAEYRVRRAPTVLR